MSRSSPGRLPDAVVIGATKAGTSSLFRYLSNHDQVFMHPQKELRFFSDPRCFARGEDWYRHQFADADDRVAMESSNAYTRDPVYPGVPERLAAVCPDARLVYVVRDPMQRLESHYRHRLAMGREWRSPSAAIRDEPSYVATSLYGHQLSLHLAHRSSNRVLVLEAERLFDSPVSRSRLCAFLGIDHDPEASWPRENESFERPVPPAVMRRMAGVLGSERVARLGRRSARFAPVARLAGSIDFVLPDDLRDELVERFRADGVLLGELCDVAGFGRE